VTVESYGRRCLAHRLLCTVNQKLQVVCPRGHLLHSEAQWDVVPTGRDFLAEYREVLEQALRAHPAMQQERLWQLLVERGLEG
jgi:hypothetical protein